MHKFFNESLRKTEHFLSHFLSTMLKFWCQNLRKDGWLVNDWDLVTKAVSMQRHRKPTKSNYAEVHLSETHLNDQVSGREGEHQHSFCKHSKQQWVQWGQVMTSHLYHNMFYNPFTVSLKNEGIIPFTALCTWYGLGPLRVSLTLKRLQQNSFIWKAAKVALRSDKGTPGTTTRREIRLKWIR